MRVGNPFPCRPENAYGQAFHMPRGDVDDEVANLPRRNGLQMLADGVEVKSGDELRRRLAYFPGEGDKLAESAGGAANLAIAADAGKISDDGFDSGV